MDQKGNNSYYYYYLNNKSNIFRTEGSYEIWREKKKNFEELESERLRKYCFHEISWLPGLSLF